jgi:N-acetyl-gamma-glutamyl-phosphate reductase
VAVGQEAANLVGRVDVAFLATKGPVSMELAPPLLAGGVRVIDIGGEFRLQSAADYEKWYGEKHICPELLKEAVYGLPELFAAEVARARLVANPGCYPTSAILATAPLLAAGLVEADGIVFDAHSGLSGAGRTYSPKSDNLFVSCNENVRAYGVGTHKHTPEIERCVSHAAGRRVTVTFVPHLSPMTYGIHTTAFCRPAAGRKFDTARLLAAAREFFAPHPFVRVFDDPAEVATANVRASNYCDWSAKFVERSGTVVVTTAIDNTVKGAAGQAVENMNIMFGLDRRAGLTGRSL